MVAEFQACLEDEPVTFRQIDQSPNALCVRTSAAASAREDWIDLEAEGLDAVARFLDARLVEAGAARRILALRTDAGGRTPTWSAPPPSSEPCARPASRACSVRR